jgi:hypothetical protein
MIWPIWSYVCSICAIYFPLCLSLYLLLSLSENFGLVSHLDKKNIGVMQILANISFLYHIFYIYGISIKTNVSLR